MVYNHSVNHGFYWLKTLVNTLGISKVNITIDLERTIDHESMLTMVNRVDIVKLNMVSADLVNVDHDQRSLVNVIVVSADLVNVLVMVNAV